VSQGQHVPEGITPRRPRKTTLLDRCGNVDQLDRMFDSFFDYADGKKFCWVRCVARQSKRDHQHALINQRRKGLHADSIAPLDLGEIQGKLSAICSLPLRGPVMCLIRQKGFEGDVWQGRIEAGNDDLFGACDHL